VGTLGCDPARAAAGLVECVASGVFSRDACLQPVTDALLARFTELGQRFQGVSLLYRRHGTDWPAAWRAECFVSKNERNDYRVRVHAETAEEAVTLLLQLVESVSEVPNES
jgi:hypothetical protein